MAKAWDEPSGEVVLEEITDDEILAAQARPHAPAPRVQIKQEAASVVVAQEPLDPIDGATTAPHPRYDPRRQDPTLVLRAQPVPAPRVVSIPAPAPARRGWVPWLVWGVAALIAFALGGVLAVLFAK